MTTKAEDRRVQRTRLLLRDALLALILEKGYEATTVQDIIDRANVGRATFYAHYQDKQHLLVSGFEELREMLVQQLAPIRQHGELKLHFSLAMFEHVHAYRQVWKALIGKHSGAIVQQQLGQLLSDVVHQEVAMMARRNHPTSIPIEIVVEYTVGAFMTLCMWWTDHDTPITPVQIDAIFQQLTLPGVLSGLNVQAVEMTR